MEELYKSLISGPDLLFEQIAGELFGMTESEGPVLILASCDQTFRANYPSRIGFLNENPDLLAMICGRIDDGCDPCVYKIEDGCLIGTQLTVEDGGSGYFLIFLPGYGIDVVQANMNLIELLLAQTQLISQLMEKNNRLHHLQLTDLSRTSTVLGDCC
jgi:hypothetical protein